MENILVEEGMVQLKHSSNCRYRRSLQAISAIHCHMFAACLLMLELKYVIRCSEVELWFLNL